MADKKVTLQIDGMHCGHCAAAVTDSLKKVKGVKDAETVYTTGKSRVLIDPEMAKVDDLVKAVEDAGYTVKSVKE
ncbi:heavy-metal-associated domain-containing protein [Methanocella arvoryzae]|uniref:heavy-metal-associated domain-containing protein n=1 Tax=Methanocella arvoryzae TaxID=1175445 RepID=UPI0000DB2090|nr:heavy-metal-associated domain-containing protein [Methanocella arvoryzae]